MSEVTSAEQATRLAVDFLKKYYYFAIPKSAKKRDGSWEVLINVGLLEEQNALVKIHGATGEITEYYFPAPPEKGVI